MTNKPVFPGAGARPCAIMSAWPVARARPVAPVPARQGAQTSCARAAPATAALLGTVRPTVPLPRRVRRAPLPPRVRARFVASRGPRRLRCRAIAWGALLSAVLDVLVHVVLGAMVAVLIWACPLFWKEGETERLKRGLCPEVSQGTHAATPSGAPGDDSDTPRLAGAKDARTRARGRRCCSAPCRVLTRPLSLSLARAPRHQCSQCRGFMYLTCGACNGEGTASGKPSAIPWGEPNCSVCAGKGLVLCQTCQGAGWLKPQEPPMQPTQPPTQPSAA